MSSKESLRPPTRQQFVVRPATPADVETIEAADKSIWQEWSNARPLYRQLMDLYPESVLVEHSQDGEYAGCAVGLFRPNPAVGWVLSVDIVESFRGHGLGRILVQHLLSVFRNMELREIIAIIDPSNVASEALFSSLGFEQVSREVEYFGPGLDQNRWRLAL